jgi:hypothetical protein
VKALQCVTLSDLSLTLDILADAWSHGAVIMTPHCYPGFDYALPFQFWEYADPTRRLNAVKSMTALFFERKMVKNSISQTMLSEIFTNLYRAARKVIPDTTVLITLLVHQVGSGRLAGR